MKMNKKKLNEMKDSFFSRNYCSLFQVKNNKKFQLKCLQNKEYKIRARHLVYSLIILSIVNQCSCKQKESKAKNS